ncbi:MAG: flagellar biosynthesis protein FliQ [Gaiellales bacterium]|nr:flagellar biosynthesis protein FliQ [Gaiellales bacterium]
MNQDSVIHLAMQALIVALKVSMPFLLAGLIVGLVVSVFQAVTQIQEQTLSFIPKILVTGAVMAIGGPWMLSQMIAYTVNLYTSIPSMVGP